MVGKYNQLSDAYLSIGKVPRSIRFTRCRPTLHVCLVKVAHAEFAVYAHMGGWSPDAFALPRQALNHASFHVERKLEILWVDAENLDSDSMRTDPAKYEASWAMVKGSDGVLVPGGFGDRGVEGKIACAKWARENKKPYLGVCLGFQARLLACKRSYAHECPSCSWMSARPT